MRLSLIIRPLTELASTVPRVTVYVMQILKGTMKSWVVGDHSWIPHFKLSSILHDYRSWRVVTLWNVGDIEERTIIRKV